MLLLKPSLCSLVLHSLVYVSAALATCQSALPVAAKTGLLLLLPLHALEQMRQHRCRPLALRPGVESWLLQTRSGQLRCQPPQLLYLSEWLVVLGFVDNRYAGPGPDARRFRLLLFADSLNCHDDWLLRKHLRALQQLEVRRAAVASG